MSRLDLDRALAAAGFTPRHGRGHTIWSHPSGRVVTFSGTPGDRRALLNQRSDVRRALRAVGAVVAA